MSEIAPIHFEAGNVDVTLTAPNAPESVGAALTGNKVFPDDAFQDDAIPLGDIKAAASKDFKLDKVKFKASASAFAGFGVYRSARKLFGALKAEGLNEPLVTEMEFPDEATKNLYALRWGYDVAGSAGGTIALGPSVTFGAEGRIEGFYALLRSLDRTVKARDAITDTLNSWKMPRQVAAPGDMKPGTWLIAETDGEIKLSLGVEYGYNYNWVRESLTLGGLAGDIGLKIEMAVKAQLDFNASGRYALVLARENSREELRLQIFRMRRHGWTFAFDAGVGAQVKQDVIPDNFDEFVKGVFNVNGLQALQDLGREFNKWTNPNNKLKDLLGAELVDYAEKMVEEVTGINPRTDIDAALDKLRKPLELWRSDLPHEIRSVLYGLLLKGETLAELRIFLQRIVELNDPQKLSEEITSHLSGVNFFETPVGKWLAAASEKGILSLLLNLKDERETLAGWAQKTLGLLDGGTVEQTLRKLQNWIETKLGLDKISAISDTDFSDMDAWLKRRLSDFLGKTIVVAELEKIKVAVNELRKKATDFYAKGYAALIEKYKGEFHYSFQKSTTRTALVDVTFDFSANEANARQYLSHALNGNFTKLLTDLTPTPGVKLNKGVLTHEIKRNTHLEVNLPYFSSTLDHINKSLSSGEVIDTADARLWVFNLKAEDVVSKKSMMSRLSVGMQHTKTAGMRQFSKEDYAYNYVLRLTRRGAGRGFMESKLEVLVNEYLSAQFTGEGKQPFSTYLTALDKRLDEAGVGGDDFFGDILIGFDVSLPGQVLAAWKNVPESGDDAPYMLMSRRVQNVLRRWIPLVFIQGPEQYDETASIYPLLAYCALPAINRLRLSGGKLKFTEDRVHEWDWSDPELRNRVFEEYCVPKLRDVILPAVRRELRDRPGTLSKYADSQIGKILSLKAESKPETNFKGLMITESNLITEIHKAGKEFRKFRDEKNLEAAVETLANFGASLTNAFNNRVGNTAYSGSALRPLGALMFVEVSKIFDPTLSNKIQPAAMLELLVLQKQSTFAMEGFLEGKRPQPSELALQQRIAGIVPSL